MTNRDPQWRNVELMKTQRTVLDKITRKIYIIYILYSYLEKEEILLNTRGYSKQVQTKK